MTKTEQFELPADKQRMHAKAVRLEWITIAYLLSAVTVIYLTLGSSQAMKTAWFEDLLSLVPPIAFLISSKVRDKAPTNRFRYGFHRAVSIAFLCASLALFLMGFFLLYDSIMKLLAFEHPSIGTVQPFGEPIWLGWLMIPALLWSAIPAAIIGRRKLPYARALHDKVLFADAKMNKADWLTAGAAMVGVLGIGMGVWWADAAAASFISLDILHDGFVNLKAVVSDLLDSQPRTVDHSQSDPLPRRVETELEKLDWVERASARFREEGHVYFGEVTLVPKTDQDITARLAEATDMLHRLDWRLHDVVLAPVPRIETPEERERHERDAKAQKP